MLYLGSGWKREVTDKLGEQSCWTKAVYLMKEMELPILPVCKLFFLVIDLTKMSTELFYTIPLIQFGLTRIIFVYRSSQISRLSAPVWTHPIWFASLQSFTLTLGFICICLPSDLYIFLIWILQTKLFFSHLET